LSLRRRFCRRTCRGPACANSGGGISRRWRLPGGPWSAVLGHAETLLAAMRHLITNEDCAAHFLPPESLHQGLNFMRFATERIALMHYCQMQERLKNQRPTRCAHDFGERPWWSNVK
jgi:hypothetical protein